MRAAGANHIIICEVVKFAGAESVHYSRWNPQGAEHDRHRGCEVFAVPALPDKQKIGQGITGRHSRHFQRVAEIRHQVALQGRRLVERIARRSRNLPRQLRNPRIQQRQLQIFLHLRRNCAHRRAQDGGRRHCQIGIRLVQTHRMFLIQIVNGASPVAGHGLIVAAQKARPARQEKNIRPNRLHQNSVMNRPHRPGQRLARRMPQRKSSILLPRERNLHRRARPGFAVKPCQRDASPLQVVGPTRVPIDLHMHDDCIRLLDLPDTPQLHVIAEAGRHVAAAGKRSQVAC